MASKPKAKDLRWQSVLARDASQDGKFVFAVSSTGVYCRPSCPARRPRRENVTFFSKPDQAEKAGYRACLRCRPRAIGGNGTTEMVKAMCRYIEHHLDEPLTLARLGSEFRQSPFHLQRTFKSVLGITPRAYADSCRMNQLKDNLRAGHSVTRSMYDAGYSSSSRLYERTASQLGMTPDKYRRGAIAAPIRYTFADSPLGRMLIAATDKGICAIQFANSDGELEQGLRHEFPFANRRRDDDAMQAWKKDLLRQMRGQRLNARSPPGYSGDCVSAAGVGAFAIHSLRRDAFLCGGGESNWSAHSDASRSPSLRDQSGGSRHSMPSRGQKERRHGRLPLGRREKESAARTGIRASHSVERTLLSAAVDLATVRAERVSAATFSLLQANVNLAGAVQQIQHGGFLRLRIPIPVRLRILNHAINPRDEVGSIFCWLRNEPATVT